tara:strand:+ start:46301 stop:47785 length:1485 start_codon:yes stop_codon:yes gene_type:complete
MILALDQGTTSSRAILFDHSAGIVSIAQKEFGQIFPKPGWVEHDPIEIWESQLEVARSAIASAEFSAQEIRAIGITNQRETTLIWDRASGKPIHNALVWQDRRTSGICDEIRKAGHAERIKAKTGLPVDAYFSATKLKWLLDHVEGARDRAEKGELAFGTVDSWLIWNLTNGKLHITDVTNASRTMLFNLKSLDWDSDLLDQFDIPRSLLPEIRSSSEVYGETAPGTFPVQIPIAGIAGDQQAALFGQACHQPGQGKNTYGTGCFLLMNTGTKPVQSRNQLLTTVAWKIGETVHYALEGSIFVAGAAIQWLRDELGILSSAEEIEQLARAVPDSGGVVFVPAFTGLGAPHWDSYARGTIVGLTRGSSKGHLARAALESIALQSLDLLSAMERDSGIRMSELRVDGGASVNDLLMQIQADFAQRPVVRPQVTETTALGAAYLAGLAVGFWDDLEEIHENWQMDRTFQPNRPQQELAPHLENWARAVECAKGWAKE